MPPLGGVTPLGLMLNKQTPGKIVIEKRIKTEFTYHFKAILAKTASPTTKHVHPPFSRLVHSPLGVNVTPCQSHAKVV